MALQPETKGELVKFTTAVKAIIYNPDRLDQFVDMIETESGAINAVQTILSVIEQKKPIPPEIKPLLAVNAYVLLVDAAREVEGVEPDPEVIKAMIAKIIQSTASGPSPGGQEQMETQRMEDAEPPQEEQMEQQNGTEMGLIGRNMGAR